LNSKDIFNKSTAFFRDLQDTITTELEKLEQTTHGSAGPGLFQEDIWDHSQSSSSLSGGGGRSRILSDGRLFEKAGVNFSDVTGQFSEEMSRNMPGASRDFRASGISLVLHPVNPHVPAVHANFRLIRRGPEVNPDRIWYGGGCDLTPTYLNREDAVHFHTVWKNVCDRHPQADYKRFKEECDRYFYLPHRGETRGIGGIFFDYLEGDMDSLFEFISDAGKNFLESYTPLVLQRRNLPWTDAEKEFQLMRRGRYVEFNLIYDRGTIFGMKTGGRIESILMSLPPLVRWTYNYQTSPGSPEEKILNVLKKPVDWAP